MSEKSWFRGPFQNQHRKHAQGMLKSPWEHLDYIHWSRSSLERLKKSLLLTCQILGVLVNTFAVDEKYPVLNKDNLAIPIQMQLSQKQKTFYHFHAAFLKSGVNFEHFETKYDCHRFSKFEIKESENVVR